MKLDKNQKAFLALVGTGLWADVDSSDIQNKGLKEPVDWDNVYWLSEEQSVIGVVLAGIELSKIKPPQELLLQWIGEIQMLEEQNKSMNQFIAELIEKMRDADIYTLLVKGQGIAQCYERPLWRACGDVDLLLSDSNYLKAKKVLISFASNVEREEPYEKHIGMTIDSWLVELHGSLKTGISNRIDKGIVSLQRDVFYLGNVRSWLNGETRVFLPSENNDVLFVFTHILKHFFHKGIGLRQICDFPVAFSNGSLPDGWIHRLQKKQPLAAPSDVKRYFVSPEESGQICMLACILGNGGEVFFPKLGEDQMLTFSSICDKFVTANGLVKDPCSSDDEAKRKSAALGWDDNKYPTVYFGSDTTGEKAYEEFYVPGEKIDMQRFRALGVVCQTTRHEMDEVNGFFDKLEGIFAKEDFTKAQVVEAIKEFIPNFEHEEKGKNLDQKM